MMIPSKPLVLHANPEHGGIRVLIGPVLILCLIVSYWLVSQVVDALIETESSIVLNCLGGLFLGLALAAGAEALLKRYWRSGTKLIIDDLGITLVSNRETQFTLDRALPVHQLKWYFHLGNYPRTGRERRVPAKWMCFACQLMQEEKRTILFTFMNKRQADQSGIQREFHQIEPKDVYDTSLRSRMARSFDRPALTSRILAGKDGRYWSSEQKRWREGLELSSQDFVTLLQLVGPGDRA